ncbi:ABC transporter permease [Actinophytocola algeriensis]|jgi:simple sugar transport system permease protein|uniref:Simple sugar transport system permease protein n=1 Tax=Actinophytocola algeriensis TaxID=1768010 RepID=A0A7W7QA98_9PSEU|nr:ABC transporter permease [Actinophytocola algeriensis]MBB4909880.1 simple sugar transport system permease protein [Actinophytocola algeriensis]MBE1475870.1 simple sugar transport system permease protein [Actinophytocola algeriensis]
MIDAALFSSALGALTPILFAALAGALCQRAGVFNISLEGTMLVGAFAGVAGSWYTGSVWLGVLIAVLTGTAYSLILAVGHVSFGGDAIVLGVAINLLAVGLTSFLIRTVFGTRGTFSDPALQGLDAVHLPLVRDIPFVGTVLSGHSVLVYLSWLAVVALAVLLYRHPWGLRLRGIGEREDAAASLGVSVTRYRYGVILAGGALCGLAGAQLALGNVTLFSENMTAGRGWIAVVAVMLGRALPYGVFAAAVLFGLAEAFGFRLQGVGLPQQATDAAPYVVTLLALFISSARIRRTREST